MKLFSESRKLVFGDTGRSIALMLQFFLFSLSFSFIAGFLINSFSLEIKARKSNIDEYCYFFPNDTYHMERMSKGENRLPEQIKITGSKVLQVNNTDILFQIYDNSFWKSVDYKLYKGRKPDADGVNEGVISYDLKDKYRVNETAEFQYGEKTINLKIVGILAKNEQMLKFSAGGTGLDLESLYCEMFSTVFTSPIADSNGNAVEARTTVSGIVTDLGGFSIEYLNEKYKTVGYFMAIEKIINNSREYRKGMAETYMMFSLAMLISGVLGMAINGFYTLKLNDKTFSVYYLSGLHISGLYKILAYRTCIISAIPTVLGLLCIAAAIKLGKLNDISLTGAFCVSFFAFVIALSFLTELPIMYKLRRTEPIDFFKQGVEE